MVFGEEDGGQGVVGGLAAGVVVLATEREESPGWRPGRSQPAAPLDQDFEGQKYPKNLDSMGFVARSTWGHVEVVLVGGTL